MKLLDLSYQLAYYKAYHLNPQNVKIHLYCIPMILATAIAMMTNYPFLIYPLLTVYSTYYIVLDRKAGLVASSFILTTIMLSRYLYATYSTNNVFYTALSVHVISWAAQFYGHFHHEKKSPAVFDNLLQPLVLAPYFVVFEILFMLGMHSELESKMMKQAKQMRNKM